MIYLEEYQNRQKSYKRRNSNGVNYWIIEKKSILPGVYKNLPAFGGTLPFPA